MQSFQGSSILIVDDSRPFLMLMGKMLNAGGYHNLHFAISAKEAFALLGIDGASASEALAVDLILMDVMMPSVNGIEACKRIKDEERFADIPVVMVTFKDDMGSVAEAFEVGATDYIIKPLSQLEILARVQSILSLKNEVSRRKTVEKEMIDLTGQLQVAERSLRQLDITDSLTGLGNRRHLDSMLEEEWRRGMREALPVALICIDIDDFKGYNLAKGYPEGDRCLKKLAETFMAALRRAGDVVVRYSGEEFAVLLPNTDLAGAMAIAEELRELVADLDIPYGKGLDGWLTVGMGLAAMSPLPETTHHLLLAAADEALTIAKEAGPGQIRAGD